MFSLRKFSYLFIYLFIYIRPIVLTWLLFYRVDPHIATSGLAFGLPIVQYPKCVFITHFCAQSLFTLNFVTKPKALPKQIQEIGILQIQTVFDLLIHNKHINTVCICRLETWKYFKVLYLCHPAHQNVNIFSYNNCTLHPEGISTHHK